MRALSIRQPWAWTAHMQRRMFIPHPLTSPPTDLRAARHVIDTWMPGNAGGVHLMAGPRLTKTFLAIYTSAKGPVRLRVSLSGNVPLLEVL